MSHPFQDKLFVFIGAPVSCARQVARDTLVTVGGITDERVTTLTDYVVAFNRADKTKVYQLALKYEKSGILAILTEELFFDILEGKADPPEKPKPERGIIIIPAKDPDTTTKKYEQIKSNVLNRKRLNNMAKHGVPFLGTRAKIDLRTLDTANRVLNIIEQN